MGIAQPALIPTLRAAATAPHPLYPVRELPGSQAQPDLSMLGSGVGWSQSAAQGLESV